MQLDFMFFFNSILLGVGLAMDACSVAMANGMNDPKMCRGKMLSISAAFGAFQGLMPLLGWVCIHTVLQWFAFLESLIPWIALGLLSYIGGKMLLDGLHPDCQEGNCSSLTWSAVLVQAVATSIDALSVGFTIADYEPGAAMLAALIIGFVTAVLCYGGVIIGKKVGTRLAGKASVFGGAILILIGIEIFISSFFG